MFNSRNPNGTGKKFLSQTRKPFGQEADISANRLGVILIYKGKDEITTNEKIREAKKKEFELPCTSNVGAHVLTWECWDLLYVRTRLFYWCLMVPLLGPSLRREG